MANDLGNKSIAEYGRLTRFGNGRNCPLNARQQASPPWSIRNAVNRIAAMEFPRGYVLVEQSPSFEKKFLRLAFGKKPTLAQRFAVSLFCRALWGDLSASQRVTEIIDGKL